MTMHPLRAELWEHSPGEPGSWHFVTVPADLAEELTLESGPPAGFGSVRVEVRVGGTTWRTSIFPNSDGTYVLPVKKAVRRAEDLHAGMACELVLEVLSERDG